MSTQDPTQPIIAEEQPFTVKVKLLSNQTYEFQTRPDIPVLQLKKIIEEKVNVPVDKQRLVFSGKQLNNQQLLSEHVKQSGLTIHLIARSQPAQNQNQNAQQQPQQQQAQQPQQQQGPNQGQQPPFMGMPNLNNIFSSLMGRPPSEEISQSIGSFFGNMPNIQIRMAPFPGVNPLGGQNMPTSPNTTQQQQQQDAPQPQSQPQPQNNNNQQPIPQPPQPPQPQQGTQPQPIAFSVNYTPLINLESNISRLSIPNEQLPVHTNPREQTLIYLRRLQTQMLRFIPQLSRSIQMLQEGRVGHLGDLVPIFQGLSASNTGAVDVIQRYVALHQRMQQQNPHQHHHHHHGHQHQHQNQQNNNQQNSNQQLPISPNTQPSVPQPQNNNNNQNNNQNQQPRPNPPQSNNQNQNQNQNNPMAMLGGLMGPGFNFANLFAPPRPQQPQQQSNPTRPQQAQNQQQYQQQNPQQNQPQNIPQPQSNPYDRERIPDPQPLSRANLANQLSQQLNAPLATGQGQQGQGVTMMQAFNSFMQQDGGIGGLLGMSLGDMFEEGEVDPIYTNLFKVLSGSELIGLILQKNFTFFNTKRAECKAGILAAVQSAGSRGQLVRRYSNDISKLFVPSVEIKNKDVCEKRLLKIIEEHMQKIINLILDAPVETNLQVQVLKHMKLLYCRSIEQVFKFVDTLQTAFNFFKQNTIRILTKYAQGLAGLFYGIIERDLIRIYRQYDEDQKRRRAMSEEQAKDEKDLLKQIEIQARRDVQYMASFKHSKYYPSKAKE